MHLLLVEALCMPGDWLQRGRPGPSGFIRSIASGQNSVNMIICLTAESNFQYLAIFPFAAHYCNNVGVNFMS